MKILRVRFLNLNSLRGEHEVDFGGSPLADAGLFAITGPTGAGKTTILDAITLALYGQVPRHDGSGPEQVMSHGTGESWSEVEFQVNGQRYRSKWSQYRARKKPDGKLQDSRMELSEQPKATNETGEISTEWPLLESYKSKVPAKVAELSGLEYRQFLRSVLLAQGDFTRFLKSSPGERAQLLEKITDTRKYSDISRAAFERAKYEGQQVENLRAGLAGVTLLSVEEVAALEAEVADLHAQLTQAQAEQQRLSEAQTWLRQLDDLTARQQRGQQRLGALTAEAEALQPVRQRVAGHEQALPFQTPWALLQQADGQIMSLHQEADQLRQQLPKLQEEVGTAGQTRAAARQTRTAANATRQEQEPRLREVEQLDARIQQNEHQLLEKRQEYDRQNALCKRQKNDLDHATSQANELRRQLAELAGWLEQHTRLATLGEALPDLVGELRVWNGLQEELGQLRSSTDELTRRLTATAVALETAQNGIAAARQQQAETEQRYQQAGAERDQWLRRLHHYGLALQLEYAALEQRLNDLRRLTQAHHLILTHEEARQHLTAGEPCPLCGAKEHPYAAGVLGISADSLRQDREREEELAQQTRRLNARVNRISTLTGLLEQAGGHLAAADAPTIALLTAADEEDAPRLVRALGQQLRELEQLQHEALVRLTKTQGQHQQATTQQEQLQQDAGKAAARLKDVEEAIPQSRQSISSLLSNFGLEFTGQNGATLVDQLKQLGFDFEQKKQERSAAESRLSALEAQQAILTTQHAELHQWLKDNKQPLVDRHTSIQQLREQRQQLFAGPDVAQARQQLEAAVQQAQAEAERQELAFQTAETALTLATEKLRQREQDARQQQQQRQQQYESLVSALTTAGLPADPAALAALLLPDAEVRRLAEQLQAHDQAVAATQQSLTEAAQQFQQAQARALTTETLESIAEKLRASGQLLASLNQQLGQRQERLGSHRAGLERHAALAEALEKQQQQARRWRQLTELIGSADGRKFSEFAQGLTLARLVDLANRHLHRLTDRYRILRNPEEHLDLLIVDEYQAGSARSMNSLSGGESFLVSLALALGLSELAGRKTQIDTLFIDEGFGTLDPDTLDIALTALETLQGTGKTIGIISHVEALKERVSTQINVRKGAGGVSTLRVVGFGEEV